MGLGGQFKTTRSRSEGELSRLGTFNIYKSSSRTRCPTRRRTVTAVASAQGRGALWQIIALQFGPCHWLLSPAFSDCKAMYRCTPVLVAACAVLLATTVATICWPLLHTHPLRHAQGMHPQPQVFTHLQHEVSRQPLTPHRKLPGWPAPDASDAHPRLSPATASVTTTVPRGVPPSSDSHRGPARARPALDSPLDRDPPRCLWAPVFGAGSALLVLLVMTRASLRCPGLMLARRGARTLGPRDPAGAYMTMASTAGRTSRTGSDTASRSGTGTRAGPGPGPAPSEYTRMVIDQNCVPGRYRLQKSAPPSTVPTGSVVLRTDAVGINALDWTLTRLFLRIPPGWRPVAFTPGGDFCGTVQASGTAAFRPGDRVAGLLPRLCGSYSDGLVVEARHAVLVPPGVPLEVAGALPLAGLIASQALRDVKAGDHVLVIGAAGGVGHLAVQLAALRGAEVAGVASAAKHAFVRQCGAGRAIGYDATDYRAAQWYEGPDRYDVILDCVGTNQKCRRASAVLKAGGQLVDIVGPPSVGYLSRVGAEAPWAYAADVLVFGRRVNYRFVTVRPDVAEVKRLMDLVGQGLLDVHIDRRWSGLANVEAAWEYSKGGRTLGKSVMVFD